MTQLASLITTTPVGDVLLIASPEGIVSLELLASAPGAHTGGSDTAPSGNREHAALEGIMFAAGEPVHPAAVDDSASDNTPVDNNTAVDHNTAVDNKTAADSTDEHAVASAIAHEAARQLDDYFAGARQAFDVPLDWRLVHGFAAAALRTITEIPYGETAAYGEVAILAGSPGAARAVGTACAGSPWSIIVPVHRVVRSDGSIGRYGNNPDAKRFLIDLERAAMPGPR